MKLIKAGIYTHSVFAVPIKVVSDNIAQNNATIELQSGNFTSNLTITYGLCSEAFSWIIMQFRPPVVYLVNLAADTMYCYSIASNTTVTDNKAVVGSCHGTFITAVDTTATLTTMSLTTPSPTTGNSNN